MDISATASAVFATLGITPSHFASGLFGSVVRSIIRGRVGVWQMLAESVVGTSCAIYLTPLVAKWLSVSPLDVATMNSLAFGLGIVGMSMVEGFMKLAQHYADKPTLPNVTGFQTLTQTLSQLEDDKYRREHPETAKEPAQSPPSQ